MGTATILKNVKKRVKKEDQVVLEAGRNEEEIRNAYYRQSIERLRNFSQSSPYARRSQTNLDPTDFQNRFKDPASLTPGGAGGAGGAGGGGSLLDRIRELANENDKKKKLGSKGSLFRRVAVAVAKQKSATKAATLLGATSSSVASAAAAQSSVSSSTGAVSTPKASLLSGAPTRTSSYGNYGVNYATP